MNWLIFLFLSSALIFVMIRFILREQKLRKAIKLANSQNFQAAYDILHGLSKDRYDFLIDYSDDHRFMSCHAFCLLNLARYQEAIEIYDRLIKRIPNTKRFRDWLAQIYHFKGSALLNLERSEEAVTCFDRALEYQPENPGTLFNKASALYDLARFKEAVNCCDRGLHYEPDDYDAWLLKAYSLYKLQDYQGSISNCEHVIHHQPTYCFAHELKSQILYKLGGYQSAIISCDEALQYQPDNVEVIYNKACCNALLGNIDSAIDNLYQVMNLDPHTYQDSIQNDEDFASLKQDKRFQELIESKADIGKTSRKK